MLLIFAEIHTIDIFFLEVCRDSDQTVSLLQPYFDTDSIFAKSHLRGEGGKESECQRKLRGAEPAKVPVGRRPVEETTPSRRWRTARINAFLRRSIRLGRPTALPPDAGHTSRDAKGVALRRRPGANAVQRPLPAGRWTSAETCFVRVSERIVRSREVEKPNFSQGRRHMRSQAPGSSRRSDRKRNQKATTRSKSGQESAGHSQSAASIRPLRRASTRVRTQADLPL